MGQGQKQPSLEKFRNKEHLEFKMQKYVKFSKGEKLGSSSVVYLPTKGQNPNLRFVLR